MRTINAFRATNYACGFEGDQTTERLIVELLGGPKATSLRSIKFAINCFHWSHHPLHVPELEWSPSELRVLVRALEALADNRSPPFALASIELKLCPSQDSQARWSLAPPAGAFSAVESVLLRLPHLRTLRISDADDIHANIPSHMCSVLEAEFAALDKEGRLDIVGRSHAR